MKTSEITLDGKLWKLTFDFNAIVDAEQETNQNLLSALENLNALTAAQLRALLYAAIVVDPGQRPPTLLDVGELIRLDTIAPITQALAEAYRLSMKTLPPEATENSPQSEATVEK